MKHILPSNMRLTIQISILVLSQLILINPYCNGQIGKYLNNLENQDNFYVIKDNMLDYLDSLKTVMDSTTFYSGNGEYKNFKRFVRYWEPRLSPHGDFSDYFDNEYLSENNETTFDYYSNETWKELGPNRTQSTSKVGIGPVEFISFFDNGTDTSTSYMLTASTLGGLFYSKNSGETWTNGGTDIWQPSSCTWAVFHPTDYTKWYASGRSRSHSSSASYIGGTGGIFRTDNEGGTWTQIADKNDFGEWNIIYKVLIDPSNPTHLYAVTKSGIFKTTECDASNPQWDNILTGLAYDMEMKPGNSSILYVSIYRNGYWKIMKSSDSGSNWNELVNQPETLTTEDIFTQNFTIEVSKAKPGYLYCCAKDGKFALYYIDLDNSTSWTTIKDNIITGHGDGHGFGVEQVINGENIIISRHITLAGYNLDGTSFSVGIPKHVDIEDVIYHPYHADEVWTCTHGGVEKSTNGGSTWQAKYDGLGVGQVDRFSNAFNDPKYILAGFYHDGVQLTDAPYEEDWNPDWLLLDNLFVDGMQTIIDNSSPVNMWASGQRGYWQYSSDAFQSTNYNISNMNTAIWGTRGAVNKKNPSVFFRNKIRSGVQEDVYRTTDYGHNPIEEVFISNFSNMLNTQNMLYVIGLYTPYSNGDYLIADVLERTSSEDIHHLMRSTNVNEDPSIIQWEELIIPRNDSWIGSVSFDSDNPDIIYLGYSSSSNYYSPQNIIFKIDYTNTNQPVTENLTLNIPLTSTGNDAIAIEDGFPGGIYFGTEAGVFYTNNELMLNAGNEWQLMGLGNPHLSCHGLEINYYSNTLRMATFGRGIWELKLPCNYNDSVFELTSNTTWDKHMRINRDVIVKNGTALSITQNCRIAFQTGCQLIIEPGGKLILNGGTLTNACGDLWQGIEVWGNPALSQIPANQGWLSISNGGTIENAVVAVRMGSSGQAIPDGGGTPPIDYKGGGILSSSEGLYRNNRSGVIFHEYSGSNLSNLTLSTFETTAELADGSTPLDHIRLLSVEGISISGCTFRNTRDGSVAYSQRGIGIQSFDASYLVDHFCISQTMPCTQYQETVFDSLYYGIKTHNISSARIPSVNNTHFLKNYRGAYLSGTTWAVVQNCFFEVNTPFVSDGGYGLYLDNSTAYTIEENNFYSDMTSPTGIGVIVHNSGTAVNEIYRNWFTNLDQGISAQELNRNPFISQGLQILCCEFIGCNFDILIPRSQLAGRGIALHQGANTQNAEDMAGNLFDIHSETPNGDFDDINNQGTHIIYYYPINNNDYRVKPIDYTTNSVTRFGVDFNPAWLFIDGCPENTSGGRTKEFALRSSLEENNLAIYTTQQTLNTLVDGGDTEELYQEVENSLPPETMDIYNDLMVASPYLSDTVVGSSILKEDVIPGAMLRDVMVANPHSAKSEKLMGKLDERYTPLPEYMKAQILASRDQVSMKEELESKLAKYRLQKQRAFSALVHYYMYSDSITGWRDSISDLLAGDNDLKSKYKLALWQLHNGEMAQSANTMNSIPGMYDLQGDLLMVYNDMVALHGILTNVLISDSSWHVVTQSQVQQLTGLAQGSTPASVYARNILIMFENMEYAEPIQIPDLLKSAEAEEAYEKVLKAKAPSVLELYPNPADDYIILGYRLDANPVDVSIEIRNLKGELVKTLAVREKQNQEVVSTVSWPSGIYLVTLKQNANTLETIKLTLVK